MLGQIAAPVYVPPPWTLQNELNKYDFAPDTFKIMVAGVFGVGGAGLGYLIGGRTGALLLGLAGAGFVYVRLSDTTGIRI